MKKWLTGLLSAGLCLGLAGRPASAAAEPPPAESKTKPDATPPARQQPPPAAGDPDEEPLEFLQAAMANRGNAAYFRDPVTAARFFLDAVKKKDRNALAQATALRAATESKNQALFRVILAQTLNDEDLDELGKKLSGYQVAGTNAPAQNTVTILMTKPGPNGVVRRRLSMRHEKAGWKVLDISGEGEVAKPAQMPRTGRGGNR